MLVVGALVGEAHFLAAVELRVHGFLAAFAQTQEQRVLLEQAALDVVFLDGRDESLDAGKWRGPDFAGCLHAIAAHQLVQLELAVGREKSGAASRGAAADDVLVDQHHLVPGLAGTRSAAETPANPAPTMTTSHLMSRVSGGQCRCWLTSNVVNHQF